MKAQYIEIDEYGNKTYYSDKEMEILHREDGPAFEHIFGNKEWWKNGELHREDGPAVEWKDSYKFWYLNDIEYTEEEFDEKMNRAKTININGREFTVEELNSLIASVEKS